MVIENLSLKKSKKKSLFGRLTTKFLSQATSTKRDQCIQTTLNLTRTPTTDAHSSSQLTATVLVRSRSRRQTRSPSKSINTQNSTLQTPSASRRQRRRSSLKTFIISHSPKPIPLVRRSRRRSVDLKTPKRLSSESLQVALIRKIQPVQRFGSPMAHTSATSNVISVTRQRNYFHSPNGISDDRGEWHYYQNPTLSHYTYFKEPTFVNDTTNRDELFSIGPMKWSTPNRTTIYKTSSPCHSYLDHPRRLCSVEQLSFSHILDCSN